MDIFSKVRKDVKDEHAWKKNCGKRLISRSYIWLFRHLGTAAAAAADAVTKLPKKGLWITELYQNDVNRSKNSNTREKNGYDSITLFDSSSDLMEYVELTNTSDDDINFNQQYKIYYNDKELKVTECDGSETVMIAGGETVVLWNCYVDGGPTEEQFRESMQVPDDVRVLTINNCGNWNATDTTIRLETTDGKICSAFSEKDRENTDDGFAVELKIPNRGYYMDVYKAFTRPAPGVVYSGQLNGQRQLETPEDLTANGVFITEVFANDIPREDVYGIDAELMEYIELTNTTDRDINLNDEYELKYFVKEGSRRTLPLLSVRQDHTGMHSARRPGTRLSGVTPGILKPLWREIPTSRMKLHSEKRTIFRMRRRCFCSAIKTV